MSTKIYVNLPVKDLERSKEFFGRLGFEFDPKFTDRNATCMIVGENNFVMLLTEEFFGKFTKKELSDTARATEVILALSAESREKVDEMFDRAIAAGGAAGVEPVDENSMYNRSFEDPDGHLWEIFFMEQSAAAL